MNLNELDKNIRSGIRQNTNAPHFSSWLIKNGFKLIGSGFYSDVLGNEGGIIIKVNDRRDEAFHDFATYAKNNWRNDPHLPRIIKILRVNPTRTDEYAYFIEKLTRNFTSEDKEIIILLQIIKTEYNLDKVHSLNISLDRLNKISPSIYNSIIGIINNVPHKLDINPENMMKRGDILVFTDPVYSN